ncbi:MULTISPECIES: hypothetical protein [Delftia]|uniref:Uncharacterized protein n=1 Tax=Delftia acidovorans TaxID=80866 RepID=A0A7T2S249_DELAC|nr:MULTISPECIES: hypothetical protein [Delftia]QPS07463.1 hypothetical protein I6G66_24805 [Delftia acidovorans]
MPLWIALNALCFQGRPPAQSLNPCTPPAPANPARQAGSTGSAPPAAEAGAFARGAGGVAAGTNGP